MWERPSRFLPPSIRIICPRRSRSARRGTIVMSPGPQMTPGRTTVVARPPSPFAARTSCSAACLLCAVPVGQRARVRRLLGDHLPRARQPEHREGTHVHQAPDAALPAGRDDVPGALRVDLEVLGARAPVRDLAGGVEDDALPGRGPDQRGRVEKVALDDLHPQLEEMLDALPLVHQDAHPVAEPVENLGEVAAEETGRARHERPGARDQRGGSGCRALAHATGVSGSSRSAPCAPGRSCPRAFRRREAPRPFPGGRRPADAS